jgi:murein DD-endopeptidase MepM/ murein hydrolase activator NlpD
MKKQRLPPQRDKKQSILVLSPEGRPLKTLKINSFIIIVAVICALCGFVTLFIPVSVFQNRDADGYNKIRLNQQNRQLQERIAEAALTVQTLQDQIGSLEAKKNRVIELVGATESTRATPQKIQRSDAERFFDDPEKLVKEVSRWEAICSSFMKSIGKGNPFDTIPVCKPVLGDVAVVQGFGKIHDPFTNQVKWHYGIDYAAAPGTEVIATASGIVIQAENDPLWGKRIVIKHGRGISTKYAHLGTMRVRRGQIIKRGAPLGTIGATGLTTGPHVHYEVWYRGHPADPHLYYFPGVTNAL